MSPPSPTPFQLPSSNSSSALGTPTRMWSSAPPSSTAASSPTPEEDDDFDVDASKREKGGDRDAADDASPFLHSVPVVADENDAADSAEPEPAADSAEQEQEQEEEGELTASQLSRLDHVLERSALYSKILKQQMDDARERHAAEPLPPARPGPRHQHDTERATFSDYEATTRLLDAPRAYDLTPMPHYAHTLHTRPPCTRTPAPTHTASLYHSHHSTSALTAVFNITRNLSRVRSALHGRSSSPALPSPPSHTPPPSAVLIARRARPGASPTRHRRPQHVRQPLSTARTVFVASRRVLPILSTVPTLPSKLAPGTHREHDAHAMHVTYIFSGAPPSAQSQGLLRSANMTRATTSVCSTRCSCSPSSTPISSRPRARPPSATYTALTARLPCLHVLDTVPETTCHEGNGNGSTHPRRCLAVCADGVDSRCDDAPAKSARAHGDDVQPPLQQQLPCAEVKIPLCSPSERAAAPTAFRERRLTASERGGGPLAAGLLVEWRATIAEVAVDLLRLEGEQVDVLPTTPKRATRISCAMCLRIGGRGGGRRRTGKGRSGLAVFKPPPDAGSEALAGMMGEEESVERLGFFLSLPNLADLGPNAVNRALTAYHHAGKSGRLEDRFLRFICQGRPRPTLTGTTILLSPKFDATWESFPGLDCEPIPLLGTCRLDRFKYKEGSGYVASFGLQFGILIQEKHMPSMLASVMFELPCTPPYFARGPGFSAMSHTIQSLCSLAVPVTFWSCHLLRHWNSILFVFPLLKNLEFNFRDHSGFLESAQTMAQLYSAQFDWQV
ncbi:hypothetical protein K438DRAFT_1944809 [Mycena galopus ATCC 62051]|nr:hypothetical protein K438DRAFT_1944809 [Mycena galopus ATCC 62051]